MNNILEIGILIIIIAIVLNFLTYFFLRYSDKISIVILILYIAILSYVIFKVISLQTEFGDSLVMMFFIAVSFKIFFSKKIYNAFFKEKYEKKAVDFLEQNYIDVIENIDTYNEVKSNINKIQYFLLYKDKIESFPEYVLELRKLTLKDIKRSEGMKSDKEEQNIT